MSHCSGGQRGRRGWGPQRGTAPRRGLWLLRRRYRLLQKGPIILLPFPLFLFTAPVLPTDQQFLRHLGTLPAPVLFFSVDPCFCSLTADLMSHALLRRWRCQTAADQRKKGRVVWRQEKILDEEVLVSGSSQAVKEQRAKGTGGSCKAGGFQSSSHGGTGRSGCRAAGNQAMGQHTQGIGGPKGDESERREGGAGAARMHAHATAAIRGRELYMVEQRGRHCFLAAAAEYEKEERRKGGRFAGTLSGKRQPTAFNVFNTSGHWWRTGRSLLTAPSSAPVPAVLAGIGA